MEKNESRAVRRTVVGLAVVLTGLLAASGGAPVAARAQQEHRATAFRLTEANTKPGSITYLRAKSTPAGGFVAPRDVSGPGRVSTAKATFVVTYHGFPANAKAAFQRAVDLWSVLVTSSVPIRIDATWKALPTDVLGGAGATDYMRDFPGAPKGNTWYPLPLANARAGQDLSPQSDITAEFASGRSDWYFGTDGHVPAGKLDLTSVVLHEIGHGLGMTGGTYYQGGQGAWGAGTSMPDVYDRIAQSAGGTPLSSYASPSTSLGSVMTSDAVRWGGAQGIAANGEPSRTSTRRTRTSRARRSTTSTRTATPRPPRTR